ncbi:Ubiquitin-conjugating enzyme E2 8 [Frankliniella fusca]|uniref:Ubiquitin-conjugating enzyme E2 8 n=1 Tax=Frankliniella fusca TaxID=407009 RepID=A0AAE1LSI4_9NEOP|nr:Ubiquitin-conjugating enzyme E2 8 [Frankliniella fusca]
MFRCIQRVLKDFRELANNDTNFIRLVPSDDNDTMKRFCVEIDGPVGTPYHTGKFIVQVTLPPNYPYDPPKVKMVTAVWHPNISTGGKICVDVLQEEWYPGCSLLEILEAMRGLLCTPNPDSPLNIEAASMFRNDRATYQAITLAYCSTFANGK